MLNKILDTISAITSPIIKDTIPFVPLTLQETLYARYVKRINQTTQSSIVKVCIPNKKYTE